MSEWGTASGDTSSRTVRRRGMASAAALVFALLLAALVYLFAQSSTERDAAAERERHSFEVIMLARNAEGSVARSEAALGRFVINSNRGLGTLYRDEWRAAARQIEQLARLVRRDEEQNARVAALANEFRDYSEELSNTASYAAADRNWEAISLHNSAADSEAGAAISRIIDTIADSERAVLRERSAALTAATDRADLLSTLLTLAGIALGIASILLALATFRAFRQRHDADRRADDLEAAVAERTVELQRLNEELQAEASERAAAEEKLRQAQKMEAVGQLTGGIAHDFNNMLAVVIGGLDLAQRKLANGSQDIGRHLDNALDGANRAAALTRRLLSFARAEPLLPEGTDAGTLIGGMTDLMHRTIGEQVNIAIEAGNDLWPVWVDPHQLENAVLNLAVNARDAMEGKGQLTFGVRNASLADDEIGEAKAGDYVEIAVTDTGCGMTREVQERVFEPFFTTKPVGKGTGLGLSQIFGFARQSGGDIGIRSVLDEGTTVSIYLPRFDGDATHREEKPHDWQLGRKPGDGQRRVILLAEDDNRVRRATIAALQELGHKPIACASGEAALAALAERGDVDLLLTDVVMPEMTGPELADAVAALHPDLPVLFVTGYVGEAGESDQFSGREVLRKPFTITALSAAIDRAFEQSEDETLAAE